MKVKTINSLLVEILIAILFFALCASAIMQVYVKARSQSDEAAVLSEALMAAQDLADETWLDGEPGERVLTYEGFSLRVDVTDEATEAGVLRTGVVTALDEAGETLITLPCSRYLPDGEVAR